MPTHVKTGGVNNSGYIWADQTRWSADTPEVPMSILPFIFYRSWINADFINLENASVSVYLRGDDLNLFNAKCYFWILGNGSRWHNIANPLEISESIKTYDVKCSVKGGGLSGQAGAIIHGLSRAIVLLEPDLKSALKKEKLTTRDSRSVERKKYGRKKARRSFQFSKR